MDSAKLAHIRERIQEINRDLEKLYDEKNELLKENVVQEEIAAADGRRLGEEFKQKLRTLIHYPIYGREEECGIHMNSLKKVLLGSRISIEPEPTTVEENMTAVKWAKNINMNKFPPIVVPSHNSGFVRVKSLEEKFGMKLLPELTDTQNQSCKKCTKNKD